MTHEEYKIQKKLERTLGALDAANKAVVDAFYAVQEASTEVDRAKHRERLEGYRSRLRQLNDGLSKIGQEIDQDYSKDRVKV